MKRLFCILLGCVLTVSSVTNALAFDVVGTTKINFIENGWSGNGLAIQADNGISGCTAPDIEFAIDSAHPSYNELVSMALTAFSTQANVQLVVDTGVCLFGNRTKILAIRLVR